MAVIPESICEGERTETLMSRTAIERVCPVAGADGVEVFGDGNVCGDVVEEGVALVIRPTREWIRNICFSWGPFDGVLITPDFLDLDCRLLSFRWFMRVVKLWWSV